MHAWAPSNNSRMACPRPHSLQACTATPPLLAPLLARCAAGTDLSAAEEPALERQCLSWAGASHLLRSCSLPAGGDAELATQVQLLWTRALDQLPLPPIAAGPPGAGDPGDADESAGAEDDGTEAPDLWAVLCFPCTPRQLCTEVHGFLRAALQAPVDALRANQICEAAARLATACVVKRPAGGVEARAAPGGRGPREAPGGVLDQALHTLCTLLRCRAELLPRDVLERNVLATIAARHEAGPPRAGTLAVLRELALASPAMHAVVLEWHAGAMQSELERGAGAGGPECKGALASLCAELTLMVAEAPRLQGHACARLLDILATQARRQGLWGMDGFGRARTSLQTTCQRGDRRAVPCT